MLNSLFTKLAAELQTLVDILAAPASAFKRLIDKPSFLFPFLLVALSVISISLGYVAIMDKNFIIDSTIDQLAASSQELDVEAVRERLSQRSLLILVLPSVILTPLFLLLINLLYAAYLNFMAKFSMDELRFSQWFSLQCWTGMPTIFIAIAAWTIMLTSSNGQVLQADLQPLSIDALLALNSGKSLLQNISLPQFWSMGLMVYGYHYFTRSSLLKSGIIALAPSVIVYGIWALITYL